MFERFNPEARALIVHAQEQARELGHNWIGTEHLLLGLLMEPRGTVAADVLWEAGISREAVHALVLDIVGPGDGAPSGHIPFTPRSKKVLELSLREALKLRHKYIGPEHVLLGLIREGEGVAAQIITKLGGALPQLRQAVLDRAPAQTRRRGAFGPGRPGIMAPRAGMTPGAVRVADQAVRRAGGGPVGSQHYLLGVLDEEDGLAAKALAALGLTRDTIEAKLAELGTKGTTDEPPERAGARRTRVEVTGDEIAVRIVETDLAARLRGYFEGGKQRELLGADLPGSEQLWRSLRTALEQMTVLMEKAGEPGWTPPDWGKAGVATFAVVTRVGGMDTRLWTAEGVDQQQVRAWLADWFTTKAPAGPSEDCAYLSVAVGRMGDVVPGALEPEVLTISSFSCGPGGPVLAGNRVPLAELVAAAVADLTADLTGSAPPEGR